MYTFCKPEFSKTQTENDKILWTDIEPEINRILEKFLENRTLDKIIHDDSNDKTMYIVATKNDKPEESSLWKMIIDDKEPQPQQLFKFPLGFSKVKDFSPFLLKEKHHSFIVRYKEEIDKNVVDENNVKLESRLIYIIDVPVEE